MRRTRRKAPRIVWLLAAVLSTMFLGMDLVQAQAPEAVDDTYQVIGKQSLVVEPPGILANDHTDGSRPLTAELVSGPAEGGTLQFLADGSFEYEPPEDSPDVDHDSFTYRAYDGSLFSDVATVDIEFVAPPLEGLVLYTDEQEFLDVLAREGYRVVAEGFEDDAAWGDYRTSISERNMAPAVTSQGLTWTSNDETSMITTGPGPARSGEWGFFALPHGNYATGIDCHIPGMCTDGFRGTGSVTLFAIGGWIHSSPPGGAKIRIILDRDAARSAEFGRDLNITGFYGAIAPDGFGSFEFRDMEGKAGDQFLLFADDFTFATTAGELPLEFVRGDANGDTHLDISDPITTLLMLFVAETTPPCLRALDTNSDELIDLSDAVYSLEYLFQLGPPPGAPFPACGTGSATANIPCVTTSCP